MFWKNSDDKIEVPGAKYTEDAKVNPGESAIAKFEIVDEWENCLLVPGTLCKRNHCSCRPPTTGLRDTKD